MDVATQTGSVKRVGAWNNTLDTPMKGAQMREGGTMTDPPRPRLPGTMTRVWIALVCVTVALGAVISPAAAQDSRAREAKAQNQAEGQLSTGERVLGTGAAIVPGLLVHGSGHMAIGETRTGLRLLAAEGAGLGMIVVGLGGLASTGASPRLVAPFTTSLVGGVGAFAISALADIYGVLAPSGGTGSPQLRAPDLNLELGYMHAFNPTFDFRNFTIVGAEWNVGAWRLEPRGWLALDDDNYRISATAAWRIAGPRPDRTYRDGSFLELVFGGTHHRYGTEGFSGTLGEVALQGRLDLVRIGPTLKGSFAEFGGGVALGAYHYDDIATETAELLILNFAFGIYLGHSGDGWGEAKIYYDHRHDGYAEGFKMAGLGSGTAGHFGLSVETQIYDRWGVAVATEAGSAVIGSLSLVYRMGGQR